MYFNSAETGSTCLTYWCYTTIEHSREKLLETAKADREVSHARGPAPHVVKGHHGKLTAPLQRYTQTAQCGHNLIAKTFATFEACVTVFPNAVNGPHTFWLSENIFKVHLK